MPNVGAWMTHGECSTRCPHPMWSLGLPCYWDMKSEEALELFQ